ncbi:hypothetical protein GCM10027084_27500 [Pseudoxanthomonas sangjuensis]|uniref:HvfC/BufC N-terminal domain-containing protein n=1 Tax=Pseudoxanthomonas sangjuensis TaxID=1503750 RepID=UPI001391BA74|nr:DNA-binding domain-containing protein [Pseudoxanthomonas sangjuensis]KAF1714563.1 hypothetical protein CSC71_04145 [Pseudoxanthomonas sangjuensis]
MNAPASALFERQAALQRWLMHGEAGVAAQLPAERRDARLRIYADAYRLRLADVLAHDFPVLHAWIGEDAFGELAESYLRAHPSRHPSVRHFGRHFAAWLREREGTAPGWAELAEFEWLQGEVFDAVDAPVASIEDAARLPPAAWPSLRLQLQPAMRLRALPAAIPALVEAHNAGRPLPPFAAGEIADWLLWRRGFEVFWRRPEPGEAGLLALARDGAGFAELCERLGDDLPETDAALRAAGLLKRWLADGLVAALQTDPPA